MSSPAEDPKRGPWIASLAVLLALVAGFFLGGGFSYLPKYRADAAEDDGEWDYAEARLQVWVGKNKLFIWGHEAPRPLEELPLRIGEHAAKRLSNVVHLSSDELTRFEDIVYAIDAFRKAGFDHISIETRPRPMPDPTGK